MLKEISSIKLQGANFSALTELDILECGDGKFAKASLVYGRNGSGKSTIAKAFKKMAGKNVSTVSIAMMADKDNNTISLTEQEKKSIFVFDEDFVNENVLIREDGLGAIVMLGEQADFTERIEKATNEFREAETVKRKAEENLNEFNERSNPKSPLYYIDRMHDVLQKDDGWAGRERRIKELRRNASVTDNTYRKFLSLTPTKIQSDLIIEFEEKWQELQAAKSGSDTISVEVPPLVDVYKKYNIDAVNELVKTSIEHPELSIREQYLLSLIQNGKGEALQKRKEHFSKPETAFCPYCLQDVSDEYKEALIRKIQQILTDKVKQHQEQLMLYIISEFEVDLSAFSALLSYTASVELISQLNVIIQENNAVLQSKINNPYTQITVELTDIREIAKQVDEVLNKLEEERKAFNQKATKTQPIINELIRINNEIAYYDVIEFSKQQDIQVDKQQNAQKTYDNAVAVCESKESELLVLDAQRKKIDIAIEVINNGLKYIFFSENRLKIEGGGDSYRLISNGRPVLPKNVSVGERNIIGLCYFFTSILQGKNKDVAYGDEHLIVIDDPVSSFDLENKVGILSFLKFKLGQFLSGNQNSRALIMTHDLLTFFDIEKIYKELQGEWKKVFFGQAIKYNLYELRNCSIGRFRLKNRQEYSELLRLIYDYGCGNAGDYDVVMGNIMRQALEAFSTFEYKVGIDELSTDDAILEVLCDEHRVYFKNLMYRLVLNGGSHREEQARSMEMDFFAVISEQEKRRTAKEILCLIYLLNKPHVIAHLGNVSGTIDSWCDDIKNRAAVI